MSEQAHTSSSAEVVESYARKRMAAGELLTWHYDDIKLSVTFFIPEDVDEASFPSKLDDTTVIVRKLPRPISSVG